MKHILLAFILFMFVFAAKALDEPYFIRMGDHAKLRAKPTRQSSLAGMAYPSLELLVVDEIENWLQVDKAGKTLYMEDGASYTRLEGGPRISTPYADLICAEAPKFHADESYATGGYWSFPGTCRIAVRSPLGEFPNEAFTDFGRAPLIEGPQAIVDQVYKTLFQLLGDAPQWYAFISNAAEKIIGYEQGSRYDTVSGDAYAQPHLKTIYVSEFVVFNSGMNNALRLAAVLVHEACHLYQVNNAMALAGDEYEIMCHALEYNLFEDLDAPQSANVAESALKGYLFFDW